VLRDARHPSNRTRGPGLERRGDPLLQAVRVRTDDRLAEVLHGRRGRLQDAQAVLSRGLTDSPGRRPPCPRSNSGRGTPRAAPGSWGAAGMRVSAMLSWATNWASLARFTSVSGIVVSTSTS